MEILRQGTSNGGKLLSLSNVKNPYKEGQLGVIEEGAYADISLVDGNPLEDLIWSSPIQRNFRRHHEGREDLQEHAEMKRMGLYVSPSRDMVAVWFTTGDGTEWNVGHGPGHRPEFRLTWRSARGAVSGPPRLPLLAETLKSY